MEPTVRRWKVEGLPVQMDTASAFIIAIGDVMATRLAQMEVMRVQSYAEPIARSWREDLPVQMAHACMPIACAMDTSIAKMVAMRPLNYVGPTVKK